MCLGAQLLAASLGARVYPGERAEVGVLPVRLTEAAAAIRCSAPRPPSSAPSNGTATPSTCRTARRSWPAVPAYPHQAFVWQRAYALQFHIEVTPELAAEWAEAPAYAASLDAELGPGSFPGLLDELSAGAAAMAGLARGLFSRWLDQTLS